MTGFGRQSEKKTKRTKLSPVKRSEANTVSVADWARRIRTAWGKSVTDTVEVGHLCAQADDQLGKSERKALITELGFSKFGFSKLVKIGKDRRLKSIIKHLPASYSIIYAIALLDDKTLNDAVKDGIIHPGVRRKEIQDLTKVDEGTGKEQDTNNPLKKKPREKGGEAAQETEDDAQEDEVDQQANEEEQQVNENDQQANEEDQQADDEGDQQADDDDGSKLCSRFVADRIVTPIVQGPGPTRVGPMRSQSGEQSG